MDLIFLPVYPKRIEWFKTKTKNTRKCHKSIRRASASINREKRIACGTKFLREIIFVDFRFFCVFRELIFAIRTERFFLAGYICIHVCSLQRAAMKWIDNISDTTLISPV